MSRFAIKAGDWILSTSNRAYQVDRLTPKRIYTGAREFVDPSFVRYVGDEASVKAAAAELKAERELTDQAMRALCVASRERRAAIFAKYGIAGS